MSHSLLTLYVTLTAETLCQTHCWNFMSHSLLTLYVTLTADALCHTHCWQFLKVLYLMLQCRITTYFTTLQSMILIITLAIMDYIIFIIIYMILSCLQLLMLHPMLTIYSLRNILKEKVCSLEEDLSYCKEQGKLLTLYKLYFISHSVLTFYKLYFISHSVLTF